MPSADGRQILDGTAGLWCVNAGHGRPKIVEAVSKQVAELDYAPAFQMGHPKAFELAARLAAMMPSPLAGTHSFTRHTPCSRCTNEIVPPGRRSSDRPMSRAATVAFPVATSTICKVAGCPST